MLSYFRLYDSPQSDSDYKISLENTGAATFAGQVQSVFSSVVADQITSAGTSYFSCSDSVGGYSSKITFFSGGSATFAGTVTATVVPPSDARFKENLTAANSQLADIVTLGGMLKNYDWNDDAPVNETIRAQRQLGLVAQDVEAVCPTLIKTIARTKNGAELTPAVTELKGPRGNIIREAQEATYEQVDDSYKGYSSDALVMKMLGAIAELQAEVEALKAG